MRRRAFVRLVGAAAAWPLVAQAQQKKVPRVGFVWIGSPEHESQGVGGLRKGLAELGYVFDRDLVLDERYAYGRTDADRRTSATKGRRRTSAWLRCCEKAG